MKFSTILLSIIVFSSVAVGQSVFAAESSPSKVTNLWVVDVTEHTVSLQWRGQDTAHHYQVRVLKKNGEFVKKVRAEKHHKNITGLKTNHRYTFRVRAKAGGKFGPYSKAVSRRTNTASSDILFGFWGLNGFISDEGLQDVASRFNTTVFQVASASPRYTVQTLLPLVRQSHMKVTLRMSGDHELYTTNGDFDIDKWKTQISAWSDSGVQEFIDDGTLAGHMILDDIDTFAGADPTAAELDEMARFSKQVMPGLLTFVRQKASSLPVPNNDTKMYQYLDAAVNQYKASDGLVREYADTQYAAAQAFGLDVIQGLNMCDGGDGSSEQPGWRAGKYAMSAEEITTYGEALLDVPHMRMFLMWEYDAEEQWSDGTIGSAYFNQPALQEVLSQLGAKARE